MAAIRPNRGILVKHLILIFVVLFSVTFLNAQNIEFKQLRYEEDYGRFTKDSTVSFYENIKYKPFAAGKSYISFGGEVRYQYFWFKNPGWGTETEDQDGFILNRLLSHADLHFGKKIRIFTQIQSSLIVGSNSQTSPVDENPFDIHQLFFDFTIYNKLENQLTLKLGRQELAYGSQRLISVREGPNSRQAFDAARFVFIHKKLRADAFFTTYVNTDKKIIDDRFMDFSSQLWGSYIADNLPGQHPGLDFYYLGVKNNAVFVDESGIEKRHSFGTRIWKKGTMLNYDFEAVYQFGNISKSKIRAWTVSLNTSARLKLNSYNPVLGLKTELVSGDKNYDEHQVNTFNPLYPRGAYFGLASLIGPYNLTDLHPYIQLNINRKCTWSADYDFFWRMSRQDGLYAVNGDLIHDGRNIRSKNIGSQLSTDISLQANPFLYFRLEFTRFNPGAFLQDADMGKIIYMAGVTATFKY
ncbi:alginate export family protein [Dyadobacter sp. CY345]|uniref:alginate export family protein n=1 Tax=Dyadobacter sp. CY345 TaxID=2909335 RepID=UPI001F19C71B|nr:alginate export family protein [Dyadobacter sp. CY345]MCF2446610.1 alginate export family protein [Dyadobacter sp. CY345]